MQYLANLWKRLFQWLDQKLQEKAAKGSCCDKSGKGNGKSSCC